MRNGLPGSFQWVVAKPTLENSAFPSDFKRLDFFLNNLKSFKTVSKQSQEINYLNETDRYLGFNFLLLLLVL